MIEPRINDSLDVAALSAAFAQFGRVQIQGFLTIESAEALLNDLAEAEWKLTYNRGEQVVDFSPAAYGKLDERTRGAIAREIVAGGRNGFQFVYDVIRDHPDMPDDAPLSRFVRFMNSAPVLDLLRAITGVETVVRVDGHASRYGRGQFLTTHDDEIRGSGRRAAYVMNVTPRWRPDWGGILQFYDRQGNVMRGFTPSFNALNLFVVPQPHSVTFVTPLAENPRYAITGWLMDPERD